MMSAEDVSATAKKKTILQVIIIRKLDEIVGRTYVRMTPGATKSVNEGLLEP
jgi:hypothetical protein